MKEYRNPDSIHPTFAAYTHQIELRGPARLLANSGQVGMMQDKSISQDKKWKKLKKLPY